MVKENMDDLGSEPNEALTDAIETLTLQIVDLFGIVTTSLPGEINHVIQSLDRNKQLQYSDFTNEVIVDKALNLLDSLTDLCSVDRSVNSAIATRNGGVELMCSICLKLIVNSGQLAVVAALNALAEAFLHDLTFRQNEGPKMVVDILNGGIENVNILNSGFSVVAAAATGNEVGKESFVELHIDDLMVTIMRKHTKSSIPSLYDAVSAFSI